jgi:acyl carrier protein
LRDLLGREIRSTMGLDAGQAIDGDVPLKSYGLDSLMAVELRNRIGEVLRASLPPSILFDHPSLQALTEHLLDRLGLVGAPSAAEGLPAAEPAARTPDASAPTAVAGAGPAGRLDSIIAAIEALSDEEQQLLVERLAGSGGGQA